MAFEGLAEKLSNSFKKLKSKGKLSDADVKEAMREVRLALLEADVNYKVAKEFTNKVTERAVGSEVMESLTPGQMVVKIVNEELTGLMGGSEERLKMPAHPPAVIMMCGLQGAGKTTHAAKLAYQLKSQGHRPLLVAGDIYRPAAIKQLQVVAEKAGAPVFEKGTQDPVITAREAVKHARDYGNDYVIIDTAGRLQIDEPLMEELRRIKAEVEPTDILLVVDAMTGQEAVNVAKTFDELLDMQIAGSADAIVVAGTTGEGSTLTDDEHIELVRRAVKHVRGRVPVIAGAGSNNTAHAVYLSKECEKAGADALLHVTPYYNKASQQGLFLHFNECARSTRLPVILYNVPSRTGVNIYPATYKRLSETENIVAVKEASGNFSQMAKIASLCKEDLAIYSGNDDQITSSLALGGKGVISVLSNLVPNETHAICTSYFRGNSEESDYLQ